MNEYSEKYSDTLTTKKIFLNVRALEKNLEKS